MFNVEILCIMLTLLIYNVLVSCNTTTVCETFDEFEEKKREDAFALTTPVQHPYAVLIQSSITVSSKRRMICSGNLVTADAVLTAAHCVHDKEDVLVYAGGNCLREIKLGIPDTGQLRQVLETHVCPGYSKNARERDIAVVRVKAAFTLSRTVNTVPLTSSRWPRKSSKPCQVTGFWLVHRRQKHPQDWRRKTQPLRGHKPCVCGCKLEVMFGEVVVRGWLCSKPREDYGLCRGDSGGGLVCGGKVTGVASLNVGGTDLSSCRFSSYDSSVRCGSKNTLSVFVDVCPHVPWLQTVVPSLNMTVNNSECMTPSRAAGNAIYNRALIALAFTILILCII